MRLNYKFGFLVLSIACLVQGSTCMAQQASSGVLLDSMLERPEFFDDRQPRMSPTSTVQTQVDYHQTPNSQSSIPTSEMQSYSDAYMPPNVARIQTRGPQVPNSQGPSSHGPFSHRPNSQNIRKTNFEQQHPSNDQRDSDAQYIVCLLYTSPSPRDRG